jgi:WD40 repeat protein
VFVGDKVGFWQIGDGRECRTLVRADAQARFTGLTSVSPDGKLVAACMTDGFGLWDLESGQELAFIRTPGIGHNLVSFEPSGGLLTLGPSGGARWPVTKEATQPERLVVGPPQRLPLPVGQGLGQSRDGRVIVSSSRKVNVEEPHAGSYILHADRPDQPIRLEPGVDVGYIAVSPDGRWVVTVLHRVHEAKVWDARDGQLVKKLADSGAGFPRFSPDSRWLSTALDGGRLFATETWEPGRRLGGVGTFSPDGTIVAVPAEISPDGTRLIVSTWDRVDRRFRVWDLRLIRRQLAEMGLDWAAPPYPPADPDGPVFVPKVEVQFGELPQPALPRSKK